MICEHKNATSEVTKEATCTEAEVRTYTCPKCGKTWTETKDALGHDWVEDRRVDPTCEVEGRIEYHCTRCNETKTEILPMLSGSACSIGSNPIDDGGSGGDTGNPGDDGGSGGDTGNPGDDEGN